MFNSITDEIESNNDAEEVGAEEEEEEEDDDEEEEEEEEEDDEDEERPVKLKNWQLRRLASALKTGRRKTSVSILIFWSCVMADIWLVKRRFMAWFKHVIGKNTR